MTQLIHTYCLKIRNLYDNTQTQSYYLPQMHYAADSFLNYAADSFTKDYIWFESNLAPVIKQF